MKGLALTGAAAFLAGCTSIPEGQSHNGNPEHTSYSGPKSHKTLAEIEIEHQQNLARLQAEAIEREKRNPSPPVVVEGVQDDANAILLKIRKQSDAMPPAQRDSDTIDSTPMM